MKTPKTAKAKAINAEIDASVKRFNEYTKYQHVAVQHCLVVLEVALAESNGMPLSTKGAWRLGAGHVVVEPAA